MAPLGPNALSTPSRTRGGETHHHCGRRRPFLHLITLARLRSNSAYHITLHSRQASTSRSRPFRRFTCKRASVVKVVATVAITTTVVVGRGAAAVCVGLDGAEKGTNAVTPLQMRSSVHEVEAKVGHHGVEVVRLQRVREHRKGLADLGAADDVVQLVHRLLLIRQHGHEAAAHRVVLEKLLHHARVVNVRQGRRRRSHRPLQL
mmetsp:Transcript_3679/g.9098  ORF Transcript_3679/g.9098 Transcript_3679/m.9098 type:complete len:204 (+) Transcript_3679:874-1485(+)